MSNDNPANSSVGSVSENGRFPIDLTGPGSHTLVRQAGVGSLSIGPSHLGKKVDLHVAPDAHIDWTVFDVFSTPAGSPWPRFLHYTGSNVSFFEWAKKRRIEEMTWAPILSTDTLVDASRSDIHGLHIELNQPGGRLSLKLSKGCFHLSVSGDLSRFSATGDMPSSLTLTPRTSRRKNDPPFLIPDLGELHQVTSLALSERPVGTAHLTRVPEPVSKPKLTEFVGELL